MLRSASRKTKGKGKGKDKGDKGKGKGKGERDRQKSAPAKLGGPGRVGERQVHAFEQVEEETQLVECCHVNEWILTVIPRDTGSGPVELLDLGC